MLMEFKYGGVPDMTFLPNQQKPNRFFFHFKRDIFPRVYWDLMPRGLWYGKRVCFKPRFGSVPESESESVKA